MKNIKFVFTKPENLGTRFQKTHLFIIEEVGKILSEYTRINPEGMLFKGKHAPGEVTIFTAHYNNVTNVAFMSQLVSFVQKGLKSTKIPSGYGAQEWQLCLESSDTTAGHVHLYFENGKFFTRPVARAGDFEIRDITVQGVIDTIKSHH